MAGKGDAEEKDGAEEAKGGKKKSLIIGLALVLVAGGGYFFFLRGGGEAETTELPAPVAGEMLQLDPITINLAGGHFLKLGIALQAIEGGHTKPNGAKALDLAISQFSGNTIEELSTAEGREKAKAELTARVKLAYVPHHEEEATEEESSAKGADPESEHSEEESEESSDAEHAEEETDSDSEESSSEESAEEESEEHSDGHGAVLTAEEAIEAAAELTVQPEIYELYFTEFVMK